MKKTAKLLSLFFCILFIFSSASVSASAAVTDAMTPASAEETRLKWSLKLGSSYANAPSVPAVHGNYVVVMSRNTLYKISAENGEIIQTAEMAATPSYGYTPVLIADGKIFCPLEGGTVQAFDFATMKSLWVYTDSLGGQALSPIVLDGGYVYTGFWNDEEVDASFVCLDADNGSLKWSYTHKGGFYWAECAVSGNYLVAGGDNGSGETNAKAALHCFDKRTGKLIDTAEIIGDQRSGITLYKGGLYFVTKAGYLYKASLNANGSFAAMKALKLSGASTSTPTVYGGRVYIGVQTSGFDGEIHVIGSDSLELIQTVPMNGYPQSEVLLSTAYSDVYIYSTYNAGPGGITAINTTNYSSEQIFTPDEGYRSYCISPISCSEDGTLFYKNDSGTLFAVEKGEEAEEKEESVFDMIIRLILSIIEIILGLFA